MLQRVLEYCYELSRNQWFKPEELEKLQEKRLKAILRNAYNNVPLYHKKFDALGINPDDIEAAEDLSKLPFTTKQEVWNGIPDQSIASNYNIKDCVRMSTSGTTGGPMPVFYDKRYWDYRVAEGFYRNRRAIGVYPWDKTMSIRYHRPDREVHIVDSEERRRDEPRSRGRESLGPSISLFKRWVKTAYIAYGANEIIPDIVQYRPSVLVGNSSYLKLVAEAMAEKGIVDFHMKALLQFGEVLDEASRRSLESFFDCKVFDVYGPNEIGTIAWECEKKEGLHILEDFVVLEVIQDDEPVNPGERGEIVVTGLLNYAMPLIRYRLGDIGILDQEQCSCGRSFRLLKSVEGRVVDCFKLSNGWIVTPKVIQNTIQGTAGVSRYQVVQQDENRITIDLMRKESDQEVSMNELTTKIHGMLGDDVQVEVFVSDRQNLKAKFRPVISKLSVGGEPRWTKPRSK